MRQNHKLGGRSHVVVLHVGQLGGTTGGLGKQEEGGQEAGWRTDPRNQGYVWRQISGATQRPWSVMSEMGTASGGTARINPMFDPTSRGQHPPCWGVPSPMASILPAGQGSRDPGTVVLGGYDVTGRSSNRVSLSSRWSLNKPQHPDAL